MYNQINISSGHSINCQGASDIINEVREARKLVDRIYEMCKSIGIEVYKYHDTSSTVSQNLSNIVQWHNQFKDGIDVSIHFNAYQHTNKPMGVEVCYYSQKEIANNVSKSISEASGLKNRGGKERTNLYFLKHTSKPSILIEVCFCDSQADVDIYRMNFDKIASSIIKAITGKSYISSTTETINNTNKLYKVQIGAFKNKNNAIALQKELQSKGYSAIIKEE